MSYNERLEDLIDHIYIANEDLVKNKRLGWVGWLINGHMCFGIFGDQLIIRVDNKLAKALLAKAGVERFEQADETAGKVLSIEPGIYSDREVLEGFLTRSLGFTSTLRPKEGGIGVDGAEEDDSSAGGEDTDLNINDL